MCNLRYRKVCHSNRTQQVLPRLNFNTDHGPKLGFPNRQCSAPIRTLINRSRVSQFRHPPSDCIRFHETPRTPC